MKKIIMYSVVLCITFPAFSFAEYAGKLPQKLLPCFNDYNVDTVDEYAQLDLKDRQKFYREKAKRDEAARTKAIAKEAARRKEAEEKAAKVSKQKSESETKPSNTTLIPLSSLDPQFADKITHYLLVQFAEELRKNPLPHNIISSHMSGGEGNFGFRLLNRVTIGHTNMPIPVASSKTGKGYTREEMRIIRNTYDKFTDLQQPARDAFLKQVFISGVTIPTGEMKSTSISSDRYQIIGFFETGLGEYSVPPMVVNGISIDGERLAFILKLNNKVVIRPTIQGPAIRKIFLGEYGSDIMVVFDNNIKKTTFYKIRRDSDGNTGTITLLDDLYKYGLDPRQNYWNEYGGWFGKIKVDVNLNPEPRFR